VNEYPQHLASLLTTLRVLEPYLDGVVVVGGWVPTLYRRYAGVPARHPALFTRDIDVVVPARLPKRGRPLIDELLRRAGYEARVSGSEMGEATKYELQSPTTEVEFLVPEVGPPGPTSRAVQKGLTAQALRYLSILLENTQRLQVRDSLEGLDLELTVCVPSPAAFVYQKGLTLEHRRGKEAKDLYYIFDFLDSNDDLRCSIVTGIAELRSSWPGPWFKTFVGNLERYFEGDRAEGPFLVESQYAGGMEKATLRLYTQRVFTEFLRDLRKIAGEQA
jgi:hypothetical protein